ncbi:Lrp/AsnC family transcriptional regulator [Saccharopolyspora sp. NPDC000359]|uniref:Lrp/AsnC family transcriptional regulator n=1 Tax=Saccharopolyspora sp. NPDC000359 TaxID=3154251 RepID=UPI003332FD24
MPETLDDADLDLVAALQRAPRAGVRLLAEVLDMSASTVSRRLARLVDERLLKVIGQVNWSVFSDAHPQHLWISAQPGTAGQVARDLAALPETQFAAVTSGRSDVYGILQPSARADADCLITERVGGIPGVVATHTEIALRSYASAATWLLDRLTAEQEERLRAENPAHRDTGATGFSADERRVARALQHDGRASAADIARRLELSQSTAYRTVQSLLERGAIVPRVEIEPAVLGFPVEAVISLTTELRSITSTAEALGRHPSARFVSTVAGSASMIYNGAFRDEDDLADLLTGDLAAMDGIKAVEVAVMLRVLTRYWLPREGVLLGGDAAQVSAPT